MPAAGKKGNKGGGRKPRSVEMNFFKQLDAALPKAIELCVKLIDDVKKFEDTDVSTFENAFQLKAFLEERKESKQLAVKAAQIMMSKAPERVQGTGEDGAILIKRVVVDI